MCLKPKSAVLLAAYNGKTWIDEQINSILNQENVEVTLFVSVDLSTDGTEQWIKQLSEQDKRIILLPYGEKFGSAAPNFFRLIRDVDFTGFDIISFADQDDIWFKNKLSRAAHKIIKDGYDAYSSDVIAFWENGKEVLVKKSYPKKQFDHFFESAGPGCTYSFSYNTMRSLQQFVIKFSSDLSQIDYHDWFAYAYCRENGFSWFIDDNPTMLYRQHESNQIGSNNSWRAAIKRLSLIRKKWYRQQVTHLIKLLAPEKLRYLNNRFFLVLNFYKLRRSYKQAWALLLFLLSFMY